MPFLHPEDHHSQPSGFFLTCQNFHQVSRRPNLTPLPTISLPAHPWYLQFVAPENVHMSLSSTPITVVGGGEAERVWPSRYLNLRDHAGPWVAPPKDARWTQAILMNCAAESLKDTRGQEAPKWRLRLEFHREHTANFSCTPWEGQLP